MYRYRDNLIRKLTYQCHSIVSCAKKRFRDNTFTFEGRLLVLITMMYYSETKFLTSDSSPDDQLKM